MYDGKKIYGVFLAFDDYLKKMYYIEYNGLCNFIGDSSCQIFNNIGCYITPSNKIASIINNQLINSMLSKISIVSGGINVEYIHVKGSNKSKQPQFMLMKCINKENKINMSNVGGIKTLVNNNDISEIIIVPSSNFISKSNIHDGFNFGYDINNKSSQIIKGMKLYYNSILHTIDNSSLYGKLPQLLYYKNTIDNIFVFSCGHNPMNNLKNNYMGYINGNVINNVRLQIDINDNVFSEDVEVQVYIIYMCVVTL